MTKHWSQIKTEMLATSDIAVKGNRLRSLQPDKVDGIAESFRDIGQLQPILVYANRGGAAAVAAVGGHYTLVAGLHRLEAAKRLNKGILATVVSDLRSAEKSKLAEIAENLHRAELTPIEQADHTMEWIRLTDKVAQIAHPLGGIQPGDKGISKASKGLGIERTEVQRRTKLRPSPQKLKRLLSNWGGIKARFSRRQSLIRNCRAGLSPSSLRIRKERPG